MFLACSMFLAYPHTSVDDIIQPRLGVLLGSQYRGSNTPLLVCFAYIPIIPKTQHSTHNILQIPFLSLIHGSMVGGVLCGNHPNYSYLCPNKFGTDPGPLCISTTVISIPKTSIFWKQLFCWCNPLPLSCRTVKGMLVASIPSPQVCSAVTPSLSQSGTAPPSQPLLPKTECTSLFVLLSTLDHFIVESRPPQKGICGHPPYF